MLVGTSIKNGACCGQGYSAVVCELQAQWKLWTSSDLDILPQDVQIPPSLSEGSGGDGAGALCAHSCGVSSLWRALISVLCLMIAAIPLGCQNYEDTESADQTNLKRDAYAFLGGLELLS